jgi:selenocysteine-specific elongation factor
LEARGAEGWWLSELAEQLAQPPEQLEQWLKGRAYLWKMETGSDTWLGLKSEVEALMPRLLSTLDEYLQEHPRVTAMPLATLHDQACPYLEQVVFRDLITRLTTDGQVENVTEGVRPAGHQQQFTTAELKLAERIESTLSFRGKTPPKLEALARAVGQPVNRLSHFLGELEHAGRVVQVARGTYLTMHDFEDWRQCALAFIESHGNMTLAQFRDEIGCGRELAMQMLDYLDRAGVTRREGNTRVAA